jgi:integrase
MALHTGMRRGEIFNLKWEDVDFRTRLLRVRNSKSGEPRQIPLDETLVDTLKDLPSRFAKGYVFPSPQTGGRLTDVKKQFATTVSKAKLENFRFHDLRHTFASHLVMNGVDLVTVATLLGHSSTRMTERYSHLSPAHQTRAVKVLDSAYRSESKTESVEKVGNSESS